MRRSILLLMLLAAGCRRAPSGPAPVGTKLMSGVVTSFDVSADGQVAIAEIRGRHAKAGDAREQVAFSVGPDWEKPPEGLGRGAMVPQVSPDGRWLVWLASKARASRVGPARLRATSGGTVHDLYNAMPPFVFDGSRVLWIATFSPVSGRGTLVAFDPTSGRPVEQLLAEVPPHSFAPVDGGVLAIQRPRAGGCRAILIAGIDRTPIAEDLDCADPGLPFAVARDGSAAWLRSAPDSLGRRALRKWTAARRGDASAGVAPDVDAFAFDGDGVPWWASEGTNGSLAVHRDGALVATVEGRFVRGVHPVPGGGAWLTLADRRCAGEGGASASPACFRVVGAAGAPEPPGTPIVRRVEPRPWPVIAFVGDATPPDVLAVFDPAMPVHVSGPVTAVAASESGRWLAVRRVLPDGESVSLVDLATGSERVLSTSSPEAVLVEFRGERLYYTWKHRRVMSDPRNGLYLFDPETDGAAAPRARQ